MTSKEVWNKIKGMIIDAYGYEYEKDIKVIEHDLEVLEFIKTHYEMNGFNELIPSYLDYDDDEKFNKLGEWLENDTTR